MFVVGTKANQGKMSGLDVAVHVSRYAQKEDNVEAFWAKFVLVAAFGVVAAVSGVCSHVAGKNIRVIA